MEEKNLVKKKKIKKKKNLGKKKLVKKKILGKKKRGKKKIAEKIDPKKGHYPKSGINCPKICVFCFAGGDILKSCAQSKI